MDDQTGNQVIRADTGNLKRAYSYGRIASLREAQLAASMRRLLGGDVCQVSYKPTSLKVRYYFLSDSHM
jgi:hypothetical protein